ncbi:MAG: type III polyketide synthase [Gloeobacteraceae cyanobacterium ES-bin-316]|nr:type III polyketide synthase [Ferruginibacter sp.]
MSKITSIATGNPAHLHTQNALFDFADAVYSRDAIESRKLKFLYRQSGIEKRYSALADFGQPANERSFFPPSADLEPFPDLEKRMRCYNDVSVGLSVNTIKDCIEGKISAADITHLITVSCTGMSAPGLDLQIMEAMDLSPSLQRTSVNFMGCYAAIHGLKMAHAFCAANAEAKVIVVCTELCTLHFQKDITQNNILSSMLFSDGCGAMLVENTTEKKGLSLHHFFSQVSFKGKKDMSWELSGKGFLMTLTGYVPELIKQDFDVLVTNALRPAGKTKEDISHWCMHPGGKKILQVIEESMELEAGRLLYSYDVLREYGNMSSASIVFVLEKILTELQENNSATAEIFGAAFGPGLTMETFLATYD